MLDIYYKKYILSNILSNYQTPDIEYRYSNYRTIWYS